jgi:hypothetical protein
LRRASFAPPQADAQAQDLQAERQGQQQRGGAAPEGDRDEGVR